MCRYTTLAATRAHIIGCAQKKQTIKALVGVFPAHSREVFRYQGRGVEPLLAVVGLDCSSDLEEAYDWMAANNVALNMFSPSSTAPLLANSTRFPYIQRLSTNAKDRQRAWQQLIKAYNWKKVAAIYDDSIWAIETHGTFLAGLTSLNENTTASEHIHIVNPEFTPVPLELFRATCAEEARHDAEANRIGSCSLARSTTNYKIK